ncbi:hypothetical protein HDV00_004319 [Rhizophlyctis rosea]|nr:hypothetical protein HDV00_004319 [Rhizophlyctis rosea]
MSKAPPSGGPPPGYVLLTATSFNELDAHHVLDDPLCDKTGTQLCGARDVNSAGSLCDKLKTQGCDAYVCWAVTIRSDVNNPCLLMTQPLIQGNDTQSFRAFVRAGTPYTDLKGQTLYAGGAPTTTTTSQTPTSSPTTTSSPASSEQSSTESSKSNTGAIAGGVVGALLALLLIGGVLYWRRRNAGAKSDSPTRVPLPTQAGEDMETPEFHTEVSGVGSKV